MYEILPVALRAIHILSVAMILGAAFYIRFVGRGGHRMPFWYVATPVIGLVATGAWQFIETVGRGVGAGWHIVFGIKAIFALHVLAVTLMQMRSTVDEAKLKRQMNGIVISGTLVVILGSALRWLAVAPKN